MRSGRNLALTDFGRLVFHYADQIFTIGQQMTNELSGQTGAVASTVAVGTTPTLSKTLMSRILSPLLNGSPEHVTPACTEDRFEALIQAIGAHQIEVVVADLPAPSSRGPRIENHLLGESALSVYGKPELAQAHGSDFPESLEGAPFLMPSAASAVREPLERWFEQRRIVPRIIGNFDESTLAELLGASGAGLFVAPEVVEDDLRRQYGVSRLGTIGELVQRYYLICSRHQSSDRRTQFLIQSARTNVFGQQ